MTNHRIRVLVAGDVYAERALVRPFLQDDGFEVVGEAFERADLLPQVTRQQPDAVVLDEAILVGRRNGRTLQRIRRAAPDAKLIVLTADPGGVAFVGADATLESGLSLATLSALLLRLFSEAPAGERAAAGGVGVGAVAATGAVAAARSAPPASEPEAPGSVARFMASVALPLVVVWALIALVATGGRGILPQAGRDLAAGGA